MEQTPRVILERADRERRTASAMDSVGATFRLGHTMAVKPGRFGLSRLARRPQEPEFRELTSAESELIYRAAMIVRREALAEAERLEASVRTVE